jgi:tripeptidyl-peptidase-1
LEQYADQKDADLFFKAYDKPSIGRKVTFVGPNKPNNPGDEAMLDVEYGMSIGAGIQNNVFWYTPGRMPNTSSPDNEPYMVWLSDVSKASNPPLIFSISYGDDEPTVQFDYGSRCNAEFMKAGARGITILAASGDSGVGSSGGSCNKFVGQWPAASPYLTAVGGTTGSSKESGVDFSGGGFSNYWDRPDWQKDSVAQYFKVAKNLPPQAKYNQTSRGWPDVSALSTDFSIFVGGFEEGVDGTSCSTPTFAGVVALLNDVRLSAGKSSLGFLNPLLYQNPSAFNDITTGNNPGCNTNGFYAAVGWDPITGLGSPNFPALQNVVKGLP